MEASMLLERAQRGDRAAFGLLVEPHRAELRVHCYRMLGSLEDAEDILQEALLAAWLGVEGFEGRSSVRTWLYRIATNRCLNQIRSTSRRPRPAAAAPAEPNGRHDVPWLQPFPDDLLDGVPDRAPGPEARVESREAISLAFVAALQLLAPQPRAVLVLRDVLGFRTAETAALLGATEAAVDSGLRRARTAIAAGRTASSEPETAEGRAVLARFVEAFVGEDVDALVALLAEDVRVRMPPLPFQYEGREAAGRFFTAIGVHRGGISRMQPARANGRPCWGEYVRDPVGGREHLVGILAADLGGGGISDLTHFEAGIGARLGLPRVL